MGKIPDRWSARGRPMPRRRSIPPPSAAARAVKLGGGGGDGPSRVSRVSKPEKKPGPTRRRSSADIIEGITRWLPYTAIGRRIAGTRLLAFKVPLKPAYVRRLEPRNQFTVQSLVDSVPDLGLVIDLTQTDRYYNKQELLERGIHYCKIPCPGQQIPPDDLVHRFFNAIDYYLDHHGQDNTVIGVHCTHGVNRTGYMLARYLIQRLGVPVREAIMCISNARNHEIERKQYIDELERHTNLVTKESSDKDIQFSRMRSASIGGPPIRIASSPPVPRGEPWRPDKMRGAKPPPPPTLRRSMSPVAKPPQMRRSISPGRSKFNGPMMVEPRGKERREMVGHRSSPGYSGAKVFKGPADKYGGGSYREEMWDKEPPPAPRSRNRSHSREREIRGPIGGGGYPMRRSRSRERDLGPSRGNIVEDRGIPREPIRGGPYEERFRHRSPAPPHFDHRPVIEEARRGYRGERPDMPGDVVNKPRGYLEDYGRPRSPPIMNDVPYEHPERMARYGGGSGERVRDERRQMMEFDRARPRDDGRPPSPRFRGRYTPSPPPYARGAVEPGSMPYMANRRMDEPGRQFEPDLPVGGRRMESDMPVGGRRMNDLPEASSSRHRIGEDPLMIRGGRNDVPPVGRGRMPDDVPRMRGSPMDVDRPVSRGEPSFPERREMRRSMSPVRPRPGYMENYGPRGGELPPYAVAGPSMPDRYGSPMRPSGRDPMIDMDLRRRPSSPPRQPWHKPHRMPPELAPPSPVHRVPSPNPPHRDYGPPRREPSFRGADEPPPPGIEAEMRREMEERGRKRSPGKPEKRPSRSRRRSRSKSGSRGKMRSISPKKLKVTKQREPSGARGFPIPEERGRHPDERMAGPSWAQHLSPARPPSPSGLPPGREVWVEEHHPPVRSRIDDVPDCRIIINKKRSNTFPDDKEPVPSTSRHSGETSRRHVSPPPLSQRLGDRGMPSMNVIDDMREREEARRMKTGPPPSMNGRMMHPGERSPRGGRGPPSRGGLGSPPSRRGGHSERIRGGPPPPSERRSRDEAKKPVFERLDHRRGRWPR